MRPSSSFVLSVVLGLPVLAACGSTTLPDYRCVKNIDGDNESGGRIVHSGNIAYVAGFQKISVFDLSDPSNPQVLTPVAMPQRVDGLVVADNKLLATTSQQFYSFDLANPKAPVELGHVTSVQTTGALVSDGHYAYAGAQGKLVIFDVSGSTPVLVTQASAGGSLPVNSLVLDGDLLYVGGTALGSLSVVDVKNRTQPVPGQPVDIGAQVGPMVLSEGRLWAVAAPTDSGTAYELSLDQPRAPVVKDHGADLCGCDDAGLPNQLVVTHGHVVAPNETGTGLNSWTQGAFANNPGKGQAYSCFPSRYALRNVDEVNGALVISGGADIAFLAP